MHACVRACGGSGSSSSGGRSGDGHTQTTAEQSARLRESRDEVDNRVSGTSESERERETPDLLRSPWAARVKLRERRDEARRGELS